MIVIRGYKIRQDQRGMYSLYDVQKSLRGIIDSSFTKYFKAPSTVQYMSKMSREGMVVPEQFQMLRPDLIYIMPEFVYGFAAWLGPRSAWDVMHAFMFPIDEKKLRIINPWESK